MQSPNIKKNFALGTAYQILNLVLPLITAPYVSRVLGAEGIGIYSFTGSIVAYFTMFAALGTMSYGAREISRARDDKEKFSRLFWEIESLSVLTSTVCIALWTIWVIFAPEYNVIYLILTMTLLGSMADISWFFTGLEQFKYIVARNTIVKVAGIILLFVFIKEKTDLTLYIFLMTLTNLLGTLSMWMYIPKMVNKIEIQSIRLKTHFKETLVYFIPSIATSLYTVLNKVLLGAIGNNIEENGYYEQATRIINIAQTLTFVSLNNVLGTRISYLFAHKKIEEIHQRIDDSINYILLTGFGICFGIIAIAPHFVPWFFGDEFINVIFLLQLLSPIILIIGISNCLGSHYYTPAGLRKQSAKYIVVGAVVNLLLNVSLIPFYGAKGAVVGSLAAEFTITVLYFANCKDYLKLSQLILIGWKKLISATIMAVVIYYVAANIPQKTLSVIVPIICGIFVYVILLFALRDKFLVRFARQGINKLKRRK